MFKYLLDAVLTDKSLMPSKDESENANDKTLMSSNEDDDEIIKILISSNEYDETRDQNKII